MVYLEVGHEYVPSITIAAIVKGHKVNKNDFRMKRCNSIAQTFSAQEKPDVNRKPSPSEPDKVDYDRGFRKTGTYIRYAGWNGIRLHDTVNDSGPSVLWLATNAVTLERTDFPDDGSISYVFLFGATYYNEYNISIKMQP